LSDSSVPGAGGQEEHESKSAAQKGATQGKHPAGENPSTSVTERPRSGGIPATHSGGLDSCFIFCIALFSFCVHTGGRRRVAHNDISLPAADALFVQGIPNSSFAVQ